MNSAHDNRLNSIMVSLRAAAQSHGGKNTLAAVDNKATRFVTISRQAGAGGTSLGTELVKAINRLNPEADPWCAWDQELVDKVAAEHHIRDEFIEAMEDAKRPWFLELIASLSSADRPSDFKVYRRVAMTIRALAHAGRAVIVGRGGVFITAGLPGGFHVRLVAPIDFRVRRMAELREAGLATTPVVHEGDPGRVLVQDTEDWGADCLFVGAQGLTRLERLMIGSVSSAVATRAHCSVEVVRHR